MTQTARRIVACLLLGIASSTHAMWAALSDEELIRSSDLIVIGEWQGQTTLSSTVGTTMEVGIIVISEVLKGSGKPASALVTLPSLKTPRNSSDLFYRQGDHGLWLLRRQADGFYLIDHPQRFIPTAGGAERIRQLRHLIKP